MTTFYDKDIWKNCNSVKGIFLYAKVLLGSERETFLPPCGTKSFKTHINWARVMEFIFDDFGTCNYELDVMKIKSVNMELHFSYSLPKKLDCKILIKFGKGPSSINDVLFCLFTNPPIYPSPISF